MSNEESLHYRCILSYYGGTTMLNGLFENVMTDVSGKVRLESEDPRWIQLFSAKCIPNLVEGTDIAWFGDRLIEHNPVTGNLVQLLEQTATRLQQVSARKSAPASHLVEQCCVALYLSTLLMHHVITSVPPHALAKQLFLLDSWFEQEVNIARQGQQTSRSSYDAGSNGTGIAQGNRVLETLMQELAVAIDSPLTNAWLYDVKFFCMDLLLCLCSTQLYANHQQQDQSGLPTVVSCYNSESDIFLNYLLGRAEKQLRSVLGSAQSSSSAFSGCLAVQLVRGLILNATYTEGAGAAGNSAVSAVRLRSVDPNPVKPASNTKPPSTLAHSQLLDQLTGKCRRAHAADTVNPATSSSVAQGASVADILIDLLRYLPFGALHRLFARSDASQQPTSAAAVSASSAPSSALLSSAEGAQLLSPPSLPIPVMVAAAMKLPTSPLAERSLDLLLILLHNRRSPYVKKPNPFREAFGLLHDRTIDVACGEDEEGGANVAASGAREERSASISSNAGDHGNMLMQGQGGRGTAGSSSSQLLMDASRIQVSFLQVIEAVSRGLPEESSSLLLYSLLQAHPTFLEALISTDSLEHVLVSCMRGLYWLTARPAKRLSNADITTTTEKDPAHQQQSAASAQSIDQLYVLVVCILMIVQDSAVQQELNKKHIVGVLWYKERQLTSATLMDASLLCVLRCLMHALFRLQDEYLVSNSCAVLHNLASSLTTGMLPYTAERVVKVTCQLCSRVIRAHERRERSVGGVPSKLVPMFDPRNAAAPASTVTAPVSAEAHTQGAVDDKEAALLPSALSTLVVLLFTALRNERMVKNVHLLYALMHSYHTVEAHFTHPAVSAILASSGLPGDLGGVILSTTKKHLAAVEALGGENHENNFSAAQTVDFLVAEISKSSVNDSSNSGLAADRDSRGSAAGPGVVRKKYMYQEAENPEEFFLPCIWTATLRNSPELPWQLVQTTLIDPLAAGFIRLQDSAPGPVEQQSGNSYVHNYNTSIANSVDNV